MPTEAPTSNITDLSWDEFKAYFFRQWQQGEHVSLIGPTGQGKTTLALELLPRRNYVVALGTKPRDSTLIKLQKQGYRRIRKWNDRKLSHRLLLWPPIGHEKDTAGQYREFTYALNKMYGDGSWTIFIDEARYFAEMLKMRRILILLWTQGRSNKITVVAGCQRPAFVPTEIYDQATHIFLWGDNDENNLKRIGGIGSLNAKEVKLAVAKLPKYHILYLNTRTNEMIRTKVELKK